MMPSPNKSAAPATTISVIQPSRRVRSGISASSARMPPSPRLSARMMNVRYLTAITTVSPQKISDSTPRMSAPSCPAAPAICSVYKGLVPMSPNTTPSAPSASGSSAPCGPCDVTSGPCGVPSGALASPDLASIAPTVLDRPAADHRAKRLPAPDRVGRSAASSPTTSMTCGHVGGSAACSDTSVMTRHASVGWRRLAIRNLRERGQEPAPGGAVSAGRQVLLRQQGRHLLGHCRADQLVDGHSLSLRDLGEAEVKGFGQPQAQRGHDRILLKNSWGDSTARPSTSAPEKSRRL